MKNLIMLTDINGMKVFVTQNEFGKAIRGEELKKPYEVKDEIPSNFNSKIYAMGKSIGKNDSINYGYTGGPTSDLSVLLCAVGDPGDVIYDITNPLLREILFNWDVACGAWTKHE